MSAEHFTALHSSLPTLLFPPTMAEVLGTVASILQLIDMALKAREYIKDFHNAPGEQQNMFTEMDNLRPLLTELQKRVLASPSTSGLHQMEGQLERFKKMMVDFTAKFKSPVGRWSKFSKQLTWTLWSKKEAKECLDEFESIKSLLNIWLAMHISDEQQHNHQSILAAVAGNAHEQQERNDVAEHKKILDWITPLNFFQRQADIFSTWQLGTGEWLLSDSLFKEWESGSKKVLWCQGIPGAGKTVLSSMVVNHLRMQHPHETGVACIYLNHKETETQTPVNLLAGLWKQLVVGKALSPTVYAVYKHHDERQTKPLLDEVFHLLKAAIAQHSRTYLIVDALDEHPEDQRPHVTLDPFLLNVLMMEIWATENDIRQHVKTCPDLQEEIHSKIMNNVEGMFLLAKLHIESLSTKNTIKAVRDSLQHLPKDLDQTYDEAMERINHQNEDDRQLGKLALTWVAYTKRPLSVAELQEALAIDPNASRLNAEEFLDINIILSVSAGLIIVDDTMSVVRLVHYTTQHYFDKIQDQQFHTVHTEIASTCLAYLSFSDFAQFDEWISEDTINVLCMEHPFLAYSQYCLVHAAEVSGLELLAQTQSFVNKATLWRKFWYWSTESIAAPWNYHEWSSSPSLLFISAIFNLVEITEHLLVQDTDVQADSSLCAAAFYGHSEIVNLLLKFGADPNAKGGRGTALQISAYRGHEQVNAQGGEYGNALQAAVWQGHEPVVRFLVEKGAEVNAQGGPYGNVLQAAAFRGHEAVVNAQAGFGTALQAAAWNGSEQVVQLLLENGAKVNEKGGYFGTALQAAVYKGDEPVVQLLLDKGAKVNEKGGYFGTALQAAAYKRNEPVVQLLLHKGAEMNTWGGEYGNALQAAAYKGDESVVNEKGGYFGIALQAAAYKGEELLVQLLLEKGAKVNTQGGKYVNALQAAAFKGQEKVVQLLIKKGANVNSHGGCHGTALHAAAYKDQEQVIQLLIEKGAHTNTQAHDTSTLWTASAMGHEQMVRILIENGANINAVTYYGTALQAASVWGHDSVVQLLLECGADASSEEPIKRPQSTRHLASTALQAVTM
ncbi:ankyrin repeat-containing domain protein [Mycena epipterygia]|nr:ankyrin repeat-containing domain protein [Mycena epipterygia]